MDLTISPLTAGQRPALEDPFGKATASDGCWCMYRRIGPRHCDRTVPGRHQRRRRPYGAGVWRLADGTPAGNPLTGHTDAVRAVAAGTLPDGTPVVISSGEDGTVRVWRLADNTPFVPPLDLPESVQAVVLHGNLIITAAGGRHRLRQWRTLCSSMVDLTTGEFWLASGNPSGTGYALRA